MNPVLRWLVQSALAPIIKAAIREYAPAIADALLEHRRQQQNKVLSLVKNQPPKDAA